jgi:hypothetical protein
MVIEYRIYQLGWPLGVAAVIPNHVEHLLRFLYLYEWLPKEIVAVTIVGYHPVMDRYANQKVEQVYKVEMTSETGSKVNWENMDEMRLISLIEKEGKIWLHPDLY